MQNVTRLIVGALTGAALLLSVALWLAGQPIGVAAVVGLCVAWGAWLRQSAARWRNAPALLAFLLVGTGAAALWLDATLVGWVYGGAVAVLAAWDLSVFFGRMQTLPVNQPDQLIRTHLRLLGVVVGLSLLGLVAHAVIRLAFNFEMALLLGLLLIGGTSYLVRQLRSGA
jgi:hypothetical protein